MSNYKLARITLKHGNKEDLPELCLGEPAYCKDTGDLYIGNEKGTPPTRIGSITEEQLKAFEERINEALELAKKTSSIFRADILQGVEKVGSITINTSGVSVRDVSGDVAFSIDPTLVTYAKNLKVDNLTLAGNNAKVIMPVSRLNKGKTLTYYIASKPKGNGSGTSRDNACSSFYSVADHIFKEYGYTCTATKVCIWIEPGVYTQDMSIPHFPGNFQDISISTDVNGTTRIIKPLDIYASNCSIAFYGNSKGIVKFTSIEGSNISGVTSQRTGVAILGTNVNVEFAHCHWVTPITSQYKKYCIYDTLGSRQVNLTFTNCDFYGYDALIYKGEHHGEMILHNCVGDLTSWTDLTSSGSPCNNSLGFRIYVAGTYPVFTVPENALADIVFKGSTTAKHSSYYTTTVDPGGSEEIVEPPPEKEVTVNKEERYNINTHGVGIRNWYAIYTSEHNPNDNPVLANCTSSGECGSVTTLLTQGSYAIYKNGTSSGEVDYYVVEYGNITFSEDLMLHFADLGKKETSGQITNLSAKLVFTKKMGSAEVKPRIIYTAQNKHIQSHLSKDIGYYVTQSYGNSSAGEPRYVLEFDSDTAPAPSIKNDMFFYENPPCRVPAFYDFYGKDASYGIQVGSHLNNDYAWFEVELIVTYKETATIVG